MIYFSEIKNKRIYTEDGLYIGKLDDLIFRFTEIPRITKLLVRPTREISKELIYIDFSFVLKFNGRIIIAKNYDTTELNENELFVNRNIIDKQIIDFGGSKVVRANDVLIQAKDPKNYLIIGVDIGILGIMRWLGMANVAERINFMFFNEPIKRSVLSWSNIQPLEIARGQIKLNVEQSKLQNLRPEDLADYLETTNIKNVSNIISLLDKEFASEVIAELNLNYQSEVLKKLPLDKTVKIVSFMEPDEAVDVLSEFSPKRRGIILEELDEPLRKKIEKLMALADTPIGPYVKTDFITVQSGWTATRVLDYIRRETAEIDSVNYIFVLNETNQLIGVFNLHELIMQKAETPVYRFMSQNLVATHLKSSTTIVLRKLIKYKLSALPVIDSQKNLVGTVTADDISELFLDKI